MQWELPVAATGSARAAIPSPEERVAGFELADIRERGCRSGDVADLEKRVQRLPVELARCQPRRVQCLELGGECDSPRRGDHIERLDPETIACEQQRLLGGVPNGEGKHPAQRCDAVSAALLVEVHDGLGVAG